MSDNASIWSIVNQLDAARDESTISFASQPSSSAASIPLRPPDVAEGASTDANNTSSTGNNQQHQEQADEPEQDDDEESPRPRPSQSHDSSALVAGSKRSAKRPPGRPPKTAKVQPQPPSSKSKYKIPRSSGRTPAPSRPSRTPSSSIPPAAPPDNTSTISTSTPPAATSQPASMSSPAAPPSSPNLFPARDGWFARITSMRAQALRSAAQQVGASHLLSPAGLAQSVPDTRCALLQVLFYEFCDAQGITDFYPVGAPLFSNFLSSCRE
eukprot:CAMPEP_0115845872 /NCGR_PEP_ID=MMETSP0287-20121206/9576_2 /TAXON_ID=412157 /ORGANISM="Chrysochromulina rotalis, Strain UIO044" /LENGTH=268 /DNA_ID=CAMNT_0003299659 /DNA_START=58 /DNA_END=864 /DNA_ORIENTATION=-